MTRRLQALAVATLFVVATGTPSDARQKNNIISFKDDPHARSMPVYKPQYAPCCNPGPGKYQKRKKQRPRYKLREWVGPPARNGALTAANRNAAVAGDQRVVRANPVIVGGRPSACFKFKATVRRYCGCASALKVNLPNHDGRWNLARNWFTFPAAAPGPGMADVRRSHVRIIVASVGNGLFKFYDPNSGQGLTRIHVDRIRGRVVNPHGRRYASAR